MRILVDHCTTYSYTLPAANVVQALRLTPRGAITRSLADGELDGTTLTCACHGSRFDITSGAVVRGPAERPVRSRAVRVEGADLLAEA